MTLILPEPQSLAVAAAEEWCLKAQAWAETTDDIKQLDEVRRWVTALEEYLPTKADGPARSAARLIEARIGEVLGPAEHHTGVVGRDLPLNKWERYEFRLMHERREVWVDKLPLPRRRVLRLIRDDEADLRPIVERPTELLSDVRLGDFREALADVADESIDLILTDPPYPAEFLPLWSDLAIFAKRVLSPSGVLAAMSGQVNLPEVYRRIGEHLPYRWTMAYLMTGAANVIHARRVSTMWKPVLVYGSSDRRLYDVATSKGPDKDYHGWGQSESGTYDLLRLLSDPGATVCDPFLGGGTTAIVAAAHGCHFIGAEIDPEVYDRARRRLAL